MQIKHVVTLGVRRPATGGNDMARILIADDDELIAELASQILIDAGHACGWVTSADEAWSVLSQRRPDVLLLDQDMPGMSGISLLRKLRGSSRHYDLPVIMFTVISGVQDETQAIYAGAQDYIRKPFDPRVLTSRVQRVLSDRANRPRHLELKTHLERSAGRIAETQPASRRMI